MGNNAKYWTKRFEELEKAQLLNEAKYITELKETYDKALSTVKKEINNKKYPFYKEILKIFYGNE